MFNRNRKAITIVIRASGEATLRLLLSQIKKQKSKKDKLIVLDEKMGFEQKLKEGFKVALEYNNDFTIFVDADILLRRNAISRIKKILKELPENDLGFGLKLWDKFYDQPKFRGLHIYRTKLLTKALELIPAYGEQLRPESYVKTNMGDLGHNWNNKISNYVAGIHDYNQNYNDIYYKFLIRSKRSTHDVECLKEIFAKNKNDNNFEIALKGLIDGEKKELLINDKFLYKKNFNEKSLYKGNSNFVKQIDLYLISKLIKRYSLKYMLWKSI
tara:strand:- start:909 stop:1721 length:813 start_codon:yes stop_codon:yes gene_type:complete